VLDRNRFAAWKIMLALAFLLLWENRAMAYVGPGAGLELIPYFLGLLLMVGSALLAFLLYPIHALIRYLRSKKAAPAATEQPVANRELVSAPIPTNPSMLEKAGDGLAEDGQTRA
jgi:hypothetical protein